MHYLIIRGVATLQELQTCYTLQDVFDALDALEVFDLAKHEAEQKAMQKK
jgi:hypothetical protein